MNISRIVKLWKEDLGKTNSKAAESLADPTKYPNLFPEIQSVLSSAIDTSNTNENDVSIIIVREIGNS